jgi:alcohol dehydrogenase class IV
VITVPALGRKVVLGAPPLMPDLAILDPLLTVGLPPHLTAATGMDAMTHAIESFVCPMFHPMCDGIALEAIRLVRLNLPQAVANGGDTEARGRMLIAASMGAVSFQKDLGAAHSLAHPLSTEYGVHHGLANAIVLPHVVRFNGETDSEQYRRVGEALGITPGDDPAGQVADALDALNTTIGITRRLRVVDVPREGLPALATKAIEDGCHLTNPRPCTESDLLRLYEQAW